MSRKGGDSAGLVGCESGNRGCKKNADEADNKMQLRARLFSQGERECRSAGLKLL